MLLQCYYGTNRKQLWVGLFGAAFMKFAMQISR